MHEQDVRPAGGAGAAAGIRGSSGRAGRAAFLAAAASFNFSFLALIILVPLFAARHGYSLAAIGALTALPGLMQIGLRLTGGVLADTWGAPPVMRVCFLSTTLAALPLLAPGAGLPALVVAQLLAGVARGAFWPAAQTYASRSSPDTAAALGRFFTFASSGSIVSLLTAGAIASRFGFPVAFGVASAGSALALALSAPIPRERLGTARRSLRALLAPLPRLFVQRPLLVAGVIAFCSSTPNALASSFYPVFALNLGFGAVLATALIALRNGSMIVGSGVFSRALGRLGYRRMAITALSGVGVSLLAAPLLRTPALFGAGLVVSGLMGQLGNLSYLWAASQHSDPSQRGSAVAVTGFWWAVAVLVVPGAFGLLASWLGIGGAFVAVGGVIGCLGLAFAVRPALIAEPAGAVRSSA